MRKELLIEKKKKIVDKAAWNMREILTDDDLRKFSREQLEAMIDIFGRAEDMRETRSAFHTLSATEVIQKETGRIAYFEDSCIREESREECLLGASGPALEMWERERAEK